MAPFSKDATTTFSPLTASQSAVKTLDSTVSYPNGNRSVRCTQLVSLSVYVPINPRAGERQLEITVTTRNGNGNGANGVRPNWNIAVNQIDCPLGQTRSLKAAGTAESSLMDIIRAPRSIFIDWLAPPGCLQYFVQPTGQFDSFNFNNGVGQYRRRYCIKSSDSFSPFQVLTLAT